MFNLSDKTVKVFFVYATVPNYQAGRDSVYLDPHTTQQSIRPQYIIGFVCAVLLAVWSTYVQNAAAEPIGIRISDEDLPAAPAANSGAASSQTQLTQPESARTADSRVFPRILRERPADKTESGEAPEQSQKSPKEEGLWKLDLPPGFAGPSGIVPSEYGTGVDFAPVEDRWRIGFPEWDRNKLLEQHPLLMQQLLKGRGENELMVDDYPYVKGGMFDPYHQNVLKGDYPIVGQHTFLNLTFNSTQFIESRDTPTPTTPFESTLNPNSSEFFGDPDQLFYKHDLRVTADIFHGNTKFKPEDWRLLATMVYNMNYLDADELAIVSPDVRKGTTRFGDEFALDEWFYEEKLHDTSVNYDFTSARLGSQFFTSDFRGFIFSDTNRSARIFGTRHSNRDQFNIIWFDQTEKDTNSELNTFADRHQNTFIMNYYRQDFIWLGYTAEVSFHYNHDKASKRFDDNNFLVRPDPVGVFAPHTVDSYFYGIAGNGHINKLNVSHAIYMVRGEDSLNPLAGKPVEINAWMAAVELSIDRDWMRFRSSYFFASGDPDINDGRGQGFDAIFDNPNFAGGEFSYWQRQAIGLFGVKLVNAESLVPNLRASKIQGQTNFVNPGLHLLNFGVDADMTPRTKLVANVNFLWFDEPQVLETFTFQGGIDDFIGTDLSLGLEFRPLLNDNAILIGGVSGLIPGRGFDDLYEQLDGKTNNLFSLFAELILEY